MSFKLMISSKSNFIFMQLRVAVLRQSAIGDEIFLRPTHAINI